MSYRVSPCLLKITSHVLAAVSPIVLISSVWAQSVQPPRRKPPLQPQDIIPPQVPQPRLSEAPIQLPPPEQLLPQPRPQPTLGSSINVPDTIFVRRIKVVGSKVFSAGDALRIGYANTDGSNSLDLSYIIPINPRNGTLRFTYGSNRNPSSNTLVGIGLGLLWRQGDDFSVRLGWGIPLVSLDSEKRTLQENGIHFSIRYSPSF